MATKLSTIKPRTWYVSGESKPKGLPVKWVGAYHALVAQMGKGYDFGFEPAEGMLVRPCGYVGAQEDGWIAMTTPDAVFDLLGAARPVKPTRAPKVATAAPAAEVTTAAETADATIVTTTFPSGGSTTVTRPKVARRTATTGRPSAGGPIVYNGADPAHRAAAAAVAEPAAPAPVVELAPAAATAAPAAAAPRQTGGALPAAATEWLDRLVFAEKRDYAAAYLAHLVAAAPAPVDPGTEWADKARRRAVKVLAAV